MEGERGNGVDGDRRSGWVGWLVVGGRGVAKEEEEGRNRGLACCFASAALSSPHLGLSRYVGGRLTKVRSGRRLLSPPQPTSKAGMQR